MNVRAPRFFLARAMVTCARCRVATPAFALVLPPGHQVQADDDRDGDDDLPHASPHTAAHEPWRAVGYQAFLFHVDALGATLEQRLAQLTPSYRLAGHGSWTNHCGRCGASFDDQELFCEPDSGFCPTSAAAAERILLLPIDDALEAAAGGYVHAPPFFDAMTCL